MFHCLHHSLHCPPPTSLSSIPICQNPSGFSYKAYLFSGSFRLSQFCIYKTLGSLEKDLERWIMSGPLAFKCFKVMEPFFFLSNEILLGRSVYNQSEDSCCQQGGRQEASTSTCSSCLPSTYLQSSGILPRSSEEPQSTSDNHFYSLLL